MRIYERHLDKMIEIKNKANCSGCTACYSVCPRSAIEMKIDEEGFKYPEINKTKCVECVMCDRVCPIVNKNKLNKEVTSGYIVQHINDQIRLKSTSGAAVNAIAEYIILNNGVVFGCEFSNDKVCRHIMVTTVKDLKKIQGSKYVQSDLGECFKNVKKQLEAGKKVLFIGMPCQVAGLERFVKENRENLYLIDLACHGVPSPEIFKEFIQFLQNKYKDKISNFVFRDKTYGYSATNIKVYFSHGKTIDCRNDIKTFTRLMFKGITLRPSCYNCTFKTKNRVSDITIFDCTLVGSYDKSMDDDKGTTSILCHSDKGRQLLEMKEVAQNIRIKAVDSERLILAEGSMLVASAKKSEMREAFFNDRKTMTYEQLSKKYAPVTLKMLVGDFVKRSLRYTGPLGKAIILQNKKNSIKKYQREFLGGSGENE